MKAHNILIPLILLLMVAGVSLAAPSDTSPPGDPGWPRVIKKNGKELTIYQPQVDSWQDYKNLHARFAIAVKDGKSKKETFGVAEVDAETVVDKAARVVAVIPQNGSCGSRTPRMRKRPLCASVVEEIASLWAGTDRLAGPHSGLCRSCPAAAAACGRLESGSAQNLLQQQARHPRDSVAGRTAAASR